MIDQSPRRKGIIQAIIAFLNGETSRPTPLPPVSASVVLVPVYEDADKIAELQPGPVHIHGSFKNVRTRRDKNKLLITSAILTDNTGSLKVLWFKSEVAKFLTHPGLYEVRGEVGLNNGILRLSHPNFRKLTKGCGPFASKNRPVSVNNHASFTRTGNVWTTPIEGKGLSADSSWLALKTQVIERDNHRCVECGETKNLTVDHILEGSLGGSNSMENLQTLCRDCHEDKHNRQFLDRGFDADDNYGEHFEVTKKIRTLTAAKDDNLGIDISYIDRDGLHSYRTIYPKKLYKGFKGYNKLMVYVDAYCELDGADRTFRVSRMTILDRDAHHQKNVYVGKVE